MAAIEAYRLTKKYGDLVAVGGINLRVEEGEIFGFLGPNGAGKTTTIHMLTTLLRPTSGEAYVGGYDVIREAWRVRRIIGIVFQDPSLDVQLTAWENLDFHGRIYHMSKAEREKRIVEVLSMVDLEDRAHEVVRNFSSGMRRRLEIARSFMHHARILFLDEPTLGLDPQTRRHIWGVYQADKQGTRRHDNAYNPLHGGGGSALRQGCNNRSWKDSCGGSTQGAEGLRRRGRC